MAVMVCVQSNAISTHGVFTLGQGANVQFTGLEHVVAYVAAHYNK